MICSKHLMSYFKYQMEISNSSIVSGGMNKYDIFHLTYISTRALSFVE